MKYKVGDKVRIKSIDWYNMHCDDAGNVDCGCEIFEKEMKPYLGKVFTIHRIVDNSKYEMEEAFDFFLFTDEMIEGFVEEEIRNNNDVKEKETLLGWIKESDNLRLVPHKDYEIKHDGDNFYLVKKKKEYPKTYEECYKIMGVKLSDCYIQGYKSPLLEDLQELLICRDAYWKIAGEEMGLGKPWKPNWEKGNQKKYCIYNDMNIIKTGTCYFGNDILAFPTEKIRDNFYENFRKLIEQCEELL